MLFGVYTAFLAGLIAGLLKAKTERHMAIAVVYSVLAMIGVLVVGIFPALATYIGTTAPLNLVETVILAVTVLLANLGAYAIGALVGGLEKL